MAETVAGFNMKWSESPRADPKPAREQDIGRFEITTRDGQARLGKLHTTHGILETPCLLPVINPNIRTIEPREMWDKYGIQALITNSYVIWKHEHLKQESLENGVHKLINFPGVIMTDSGTFQSYIYGDVEVGVEEIVQFQKEIGVDIATMLDVFTRPDMNEIQVEEAVNETIRRSEISLATADGTMLNGPIQGGVFSHLRVKSSIEMSNFDFAIHPIGGIVPIMEQHHYKDLIKIMFACKTNLNPSRPVHMFGCGHPMLFPMLIAMGADLFDSAAYALFARDGRLLTPWGTERIDEMTEWPILVPAVCNHTPEDVRKMNDDDKNAILARFNLEVTLQEMSRCRQAVRDGTIWRLVEQRSHQHPALREAFLWLITSPSKTSMPPIIVDEISASKEVGSERGEWENCWNWLIGSQTTPRTGSEQWGGSDTLQRPHVAMARIRLESRWVSRKTGDVLILHGAPAPWRERVGELIDRLSGLDLEILIHTPLGLVPWNLEDLNPWAHIEGPSWLWSGEPDLARIRIELEKLGITDSKILCLDLSQSEGLHQRAFDLLEMEPTEKKTEEKKRAQIVDKLCVLNNVNQQDAITILEGATFTMSRTGRIRNVITAEGIHLFSPRLAEGGVSFTIEGAKWAHSIRKERIPSGFEQNSITKHVGKGLAFVVVDDDAAPFIQQGRNVMHGFILACDSWMRPNETVLIVDKTGKLLGVGRSQATITEMATFRKGIAVKIREGCP